MFEHTYIQPDAPEPRVVTVNPARNAVYVGGDAGLSVIPL